MCVCARARVCSLRHTACKAHVWYYIVICGRSGSIIISTLPYTQHDSQKKIMEHKMCVLLFSTNFLVSFLILRTVERDIIINVQMSSCKVNVILVRFQSNFRGRFSKSGQISSFIKIRSVGAELFHVDGRTDRQMDGQAVTHISRS